MPEKLKAEIEESVRGRNRTRPAHKGRTPEQSAYAIMNDMGAMRGSRTTRKGRRYERKLTAQDAGDAIAKSLQRA